jgi:hypothetical protein
MIIEAEIPNETRTPRRKQRPARTLRVARLLALAHRMRAMLDRGEAKSQADLANRMGMCPARVTQLLELLLLAPDIQEEIAFGAVERGRDWISEHSLRPIVALTDWNEQRSRWQELRTAGRVAST